jgi:hypothetical protein
MVGRDSVVGIATFHGLDGSRLKSWCAQEIYCFPYPPRPPLQPTQLPLQWVAELFSEGKVAGAWP